MLIDVSHTIESGMITYRGLPAPYVCDLLSRKESRKYYALGTEFHIGRIDMVANTGTYLDSPFHRFADGKDVATLPLEHTANLPGIVVRLKIGGNRAIDARAFDSMDLRGKAVLLRTAWDAHWRSDQYFDGHPFLTAAAAAHLVEAGAVLVGIDSLNIDDTADGTRPVHTTLLHAGVPIVEHLTGLAHLPDTGFQFFAAPVKVSGMGTFPVRAFGII